ncbi:MAG: hypothetical protein JNK02_00215 [Planctomycetes bacterium]|nr:hypothetical protein [Planctomycetota bacterium]
MRRRHGSLPEVAQTWPGSVAFELLLGVCAANDPHAALAERRRALA